LSSSPAVRFAALMHDLGKARTSPERWPSHHGHEEAGVPLIEALAARLRVPNEYRELAVLAARHHGVIHRAAELRPSTVLELLEKTDAFRRPERFDNLLIACEADARGRAGLEDREYPQAHYIRRARDAAAAATLSDGERSGLSGEAIGATLRKKRLAAITVVKETLALPISQKSS
jgi:tRNA nucleotidyltransferase (CCA-adding enzyme)